MIKFTLYRVENGYCLNCQWGKKLKTYVFTGLDRNTRTRALAEIDRWLEKIEKTEINDKKEN